MNIKGKPGNPAMKGYDKVSNKGLSKTFNRLFKYLTRYKFQLLVVVISILLSSVVTILSSVMIQPLIDNYILPLVGVANPDFSSFINYLLLLMCVFLSGAFLSFLYNRLMINISLGTLKRIRDEMFSHMQKLPIKFFDSNTHGNLMSRFTNDTDALRQMLSQSIPQLINSVFMVTGVFLAMCFYSWVLALLVLCVVFIMVVVVKKIGSKSAKYFLQQQISVGGLNGYIEEMVEGQKVVKVFNHEEKARSGFDKVNEQLCGDGTKANTYANILMPIVGNLGYLMYSLVAIVGSIFAINGLFGLTIGALVVFLLLTRSFAQPISQISMHINAIIMALSGAKRIFELLDQPIETETGSITLVKAEKDADGTLTENQTGGIWCWKKPVEGGKAELIELKGDVRFHDVVFGYNDDKVVLQNVSLYAKPGQKIAFVGSTGAGKTTITNLINRFYDIQQGMITYDGLDLKEIKKSELRKSLGIVLQDTHLFTGTIKDNIRYGKLDATDEEVYVAANLANADFFIRHLPDGYDTVITGDGANLSQGQKQLLSIARAAIADSPVLILDEATSSIDTRTEKIIERGMDKLMEGRTVFVIAHRLSTVRNSQAIMVLENGRIIERGNHDDLIKQHGKYYQLYTGAFELS